MNKIFISTLLFFTINNAFSYDLTLKFKTKKEAQEWAIWYLDGGGEQIAEYSAVNFNIKKLMTNEGQNNNDRPYLFLVKDKENRL